MFGRSTLVTIYLKLAQANSLTLATTKALPKSTELENFWGRLILAETALTSYFTIRNNNQKRPLLFLNFLPLKLNLTALLK